MKVAVYTLGCKVNTYESEYVIKEFLKRGYTLTDFSDSNADVYLINTCTVTNTSDQKSRKMIRQARAKNKDAVVVAMGCFTQIRNNDNQIMDFVDVVIGNKDKSIINELIKEYIDTKKRYVKFYNDRDLDFEDMLIDDYNHVRAFIKIEDGCDNFCSYCIIPYVRGSVRSKSFNKVIEEAKHLAHHGHKEIVLTGIHTGHYEDSGHDLTDLINELSKIEELKRIRISSIEITELNDKFLDMLGKNDKVCNHLHIPLQAGSDEILKRMNRKYDLKYYEEKINKIRSIRPDISISTDIIVGFPYETEELFTSTLKFSEKMKFSKIHVFPYSIRKGTAAASMPEQIDESIKKDRVKRLMALSEKMEEEYYNKFKGKSLDILVEEVNDNVSIGHTSNYLKIEVPEKLNKNEIYTVTYNGGK